MDNNELAVLGKLLIPGTPVVLTESFVFSPKEDEEQSAIAEELYQKVKDWAAAWSARSATYFDFYNKEAYTIAQREPFSAFQANKERLFKLLPWIRTTASHIQVLQGPGYWVTWFYQDYQAPNLKTRGVRRLYWMRDGGEFKIVGMEWRPGLSTSSTLVASAGPLLPPLETHLPAVIPDGWIVADADTPGFYGVVAVAEGRLPPRITASASPGLTVASGPVDEVPVQVVPVPETSPITTSATGADVVLLAAESGADSEAVSVTSSAAAAVLALAEGVSSRSTDHVESPSLGTMARPSQEAVRMAREERLRQRNEQADGLRVAVNESGTTLPPPLPAQGLAESSQVLPPAVHAQQMAAPAQQESGEPQQGLHAATSEAVVHAAAVDAPPTSATQAVLNDEELASQVITIVQSWRAAWEQADLEAYMTYYAPRARQGARRSAEAIRKQKEELWSRLKPASVQLEDIRVSVKGDTAQVVMRQKYVNEKGNGSIGRKTLALSLRDGAWLITQEDWSALPHEISN
jgi:ketosteroid isomerase-like protein